MKKTVIFFLVILFVSPLTARAEVNLSGRVKLFSSLFLKKNTDGLYFIHDSSEFATKRLETRLRFSGFLSDQISYSVRFHSFSQPDALFSEWRFPESSPSGAPTQAEPFDLFLYEGNIRVTDFIIKGLDFSLGKQRIQWGTADKVNVVDNLNPIDFANFLTFDPDYFAERRPETALNFEYFFSGFTKIQLVWLLSRQIAPLPSNFSDMVTQGLMPTYVKIETENKLLQNTNVGLRFSTVLLNTDLGLSYYRGNFGLPRLYGVTPTSLTGLEYSYKYPQKEVFGLDAAGEIFSVGFWAELAYVRPEDVDGFAFISIPVNGGPSLVKKTFSLFEDSYLKYVLGADYTLDIGSGIYLNAQYLHGFFDETDYSSQAQSLFGFEKGMFFGEIEDYILARVEHSLLREKLTLELGGLVEFSGQGRSFSFMPSLEYKIKDLVTFQAGGFMVSGDENHTKFGSFKKDNILFFAFKTDF
ncbi:MAG TPA: DUF1302 family protein [Acidobacteriota bacterium]|nr:DUF1302 family protein [Acidobacteriota bacterium]